MLEACMGTETAENFHPVSLSLWKVSDSSSLRNISGPLSRSLPKDPSARPLIDTLERTDRSSTERRRPVAEHRRRQAPGAQTSPHYTHATLCHRKSIACPTDTDANAQSIRRCHLLADQVRNERAEGVVCDRSVKCRLDLGLFSTMRRTVNLRFTCAIFVGTCDLISFLSSSDRNIGILNL